MIKISEAIKAINPTSEFSVKAEDYEQITWFNNTTPISEADIKDKQSELQVEYDALEWERNRKTEYPSIEECVHAILDDDLENLQILRQAIKTKYPKT